MVVQEDVYYLVWSVVLIQLLDFKYSVDHIITVVDRILG